MGCTTSVKLTDTDKELLRISINDKDKFSIQFNYLSNLPLSGQDKRYLEKTAYQHLLLQTK